MLKFSKIAAIGRTYRHINRYREILGLLIKHGLGDVLDMLKVEPHIVAGIKVLRKDYESSEERLTRPERTRLAFEELGTTFIKFAQVISSHKDLLPEEYGREFEKLQDNVPPEDFDQLREIIYEEVGAYPEDVFKFFHKEPLAAASIGQVHRAKLKSGEEVVVKVQRPHIQSKIEIDLEILHYLAQLAERHIEDMKLLQPVKIIEELSRALEKELDFRIEASHNELFRKKTKDDQSIYAPRLYRELSTQRMMTTEFIDGVKPVDVALLKEKGYDVEVIAENMASSLMKQVFEYGFFHADPHPGNLFILDDNVICYIDFGQLGRISQRECDALVDMARHTVNRKEKKLVDVLMQLVSFEIQPDRENLERDICEFLDHYLGLTLKELDLTHIFKSLTKILTQHGLLIKPHFFLMFKTFGMIEGLCRQLNPNINLADHAHPYLTKIYLRRFDPRRLSENMIESGMNFANLLHEIPQELNSLLRFIKEGKFTLDLRHIDMHPLINVIQAAFLKLVLALIFSAVFGGSCLLVLAGKGPLLFGVSVLAWLGFLSSGVILTLIAYLIVMSKRDR
ncbi:MAG: AarF/ABC1/UbiB kinase family protein [Planctomycetes bacterium]|nr:AarF/ABC1/UbiB kinase family protein [Planctomycetota bacterium]